MPDNELNPVVGIDLGTTFSCIARWAGDRPEVVKGPDGQDTLPSIVYIQDSGTPLVGRFARQRLIIDPPNAVEHAKRHMGDESKVYNLRGKDHTPVDISSMILNCLKEGYAKKFPGNSGFELAGVVITHPQYFKYPQIAQTQQAAENADLPVIRLLAEPVAAALDYGFTTYKDLDEEKVERILVFDLGGGTFDVTVLEVLNELNTLTFRVLSVGGDAMLGGTNFDDAFLDWSLKEAGIDLSSLDPTARDRSMAKLVDAIIEAKIQLSSMDEVFLAVPNVLPNEHLDIEVARDQFNEIIEPFCSRVRRIVTSTIASANLRAGELDRTIMVGGSSRIPIMKQIVHEETGAEPWANADPDLAVCRGAALVAAMEDGRVDTKKELVIEEATSHALGVRAANDKFAILIPPNRPAPVQATKIFTVKSDNITVTLYQGKGKKVTEKDVIELKPIPITGVELGESGKADVKITFKVNEQQILFYKIEAPGVYEEGQVEF
ncbi:Hsp70 family protein [Mariniblastus sp.]|nr:Hsp70 family protein [Mariniblastus sp.]